MMTNNAFFSDRDSIASDSIVSKNPGISKVNLKNKINASPKPAIDYRAFLDDVYAQLTVDQVYTNVSHKFKGSGNKYRGGCPFHDSKSGTSFVVSENNLLFFCSGCQFGGSPIDYLHSLKVGRWEKPKGKEFVESAKQLSELAGVAFPNIERSPEEIEKIRLWESRRAILKDVAQYGEEVLWSSLGVDARNYLIQERGFTEEQIESLGLGLYLNRKDVEKVLLAKGHSVDELKSSGVIWSKLEGYILFPWNDSQGKPLTLYARYPSKQTPEGKPKTIALKGEGTKQSPLYFDRVLQAKYQEIVAVEGVIDAALLQALGDHRVCAYVGASFSDDQIKTLVRQGIKLITLCGDPDAGGESGTLSNIRRLMLAGINEIYVAPKLPGGLDPDEFVKREGIEGWRKHICSADHALAYMAQSIIQKYDITNDRGKSAVINEATAFDKQFTEFQQKIALEMFFWKEICERLGINREQFKNNYAENNNTNEVYEDSENNNTSQQHPESFYKSICKQLGLDFNNCVTARAFDTWIYESQFGGAEGDWKVIDSSFYRWNEHLNTWQHQPENRVCTLIADLGGNAFRLSHTEKFQWQVFFPYGTNGFKESAFKYIRSRLERSEIARANNLLQAFRNCVVDMITGETMPHNKVYYLTNIIPYDYEPNKSCPEVFREFIVDSFGEDMIEVIRAFTSMFLDPSAPYGRFPHLIGQSGGGKGTLGRFWSSLFGNEGSSSASYFSDISTPEGRHQHLSGKRIIGFPDMGGYAEGVRAFYELVDNGEMSGRALFNPVAYAKQWNIRFWLASVNHLQIENAGDGWARRAYPIPVRGRGILPDSNLRLKLEAAKADVISWALAMPKEERDRILLSPPESERAINLAKDAALYGDSARSFIDLCLRPSSQAGYVEHHQLHTWYVAYCREHGYTPLGMSKFISHLKTVLPKNFVERHWQPMQNGVRVRVQAHWEYLAPLPFTFVSGQGSRDSGENSQPPQNPLWTCIKSKCVEGGLDEFEAFWKPPQTPEPSQGAGVQGVQGENSQQRHPGQAETQSQQGCPNCPTVQNQSLAMEKLETEKIKISSSSPLTDTPQLGMDNLDSLDTRTVTGFQPVQFVDEPKNEDGHPGHPCHQQVSHNSVVLPDVGWWVLVDDAYLAKVIQHLFDDVVKLDGHSARNNIYGSYRPEQYRILSMSEIKIKKLPFNL